MCIIYKPSVFIIYRINVNHEIITDESIVIQLIHLDGHMGIE